MTMRHLLFLLGIAAALTAGATTAARADDFAGDVPTRIWIDLGGASSGISTTAALTGKAGVGASLDFEDVFELPGTKYTARLFGTARISDHRRYIDFGFVDINRSGSTIVDQDITWGDNTFTAGGTMTAKFRSQFIYCAYRYDFLNVEKVHIAGSAGLSWAQLSASLIGEGNATDSNGTPIAGEFESKSSIGAPVPMIGLNLDWAITRRLILRSYNRVFGLNLSTIKGNVYESGMHLNWLFVRHFGLGVAYDKNEIKIKEFKTGDNKGKFDYRVASLGLNLNFAW
jgi:hypothetical protein